MNQKEHWDILLSNEVNKKEFVEILLSGQATQQLAFLNNSKGILFSDLAITNYLEQEERYQTSESIKTSNRKLITFSSGERKKAFLKYCLSQNPDFIILDNPLDHLDQNSRKELVIALEHLSQTVCLIQLINRSADQLSFIKNKIFINNNSFVLEASNNNKKQDFILDETSIPSAITTIEKSDEVLIKFDGVSVAYEDRKIINNISWTIKKGEFWQLVGPNGSGKSTLLSMITGDNQKAYGQNIYLFGNKKGSGETIWDIKKKIGIYTTSMTDLFQKRETVENMILSGYFDSIGLYVEPTSFQRQTVAKWLNLINLSPLKNQYFNRISIGQQRIVLILRAVIKHPQLVILDEPFEGLDDENVALVGQLINVLKKETDMTLIFVSHRVEPVLSPNLVFELIPSTNGSEGRAIQMTEQHHKSI